MEIYRLHNGNLTMAGTRFGKASTDTSFFASYVSLHLRLTMCVCVCVCVPGS